MRLLHTSDWHLGIRLHGTSLLDEQREMIDQLCGYLHTARIDAVVVAGDLFDHAIAPPEAIALYTEAMVRLCRDCAVPVLLIAGNHDGAERLATCAALLRDAGLVISGKLTPETLHPISIGDADFFLMPYFHLDQVRLLLPGAAPRSYSEAMALLTAAMRKRFSPGRKQILIAHCFTAGAALSESDRAAAVGGSSQISREVFEGFDYVALGHLHRAQQFGGVRYSGSPFPYAFSEAEQPKSFTVYDTATGQLETLPIKTTRTLRVCTGSFDRLLDQAAFDAHPDDYLKLVLTDRPAGLESLSALRESYPNLLLLTGKDPAFDERLTSLTVEELTALDPLALMQRFYYESMGEPPDEEQEGWFLQAAAQLEEEGMQ